MKINLIKFFILCIFILVYIVFLHITEYRIKKLKKVIKKNKIYIMKKKAVFFLLCIFLIGIYSFLKIT